MMKKKEFMEHYSNMYGVPITELTLEEYHQKLNSDKIFPAYPYFISDPSLLKEFMDRNGRNREVKPDAVQNYRECMQTGLFRYENPDPIVFDDEKDKINGGHRSVSAHEYLTLDNPEGCVLFSIGFGFPREVANAMDRNKIRRIRDCMKIANDIQMSGENEKTINAYYFCKGRDHVKAQIEKACDFYMDNQRAIDMVCDSINVNHAVSKKGFLNVAPAVNAAFVDMLIENPEYFDSIIEFLETCLTHHIREFPETSTHNRFIRMLQDQRILGTVETSVDRKRLFRDVEEILRRFINGETMISPITVSKAGASEPSHKLRKRLKDKCELILRNYDICFPAEAQ